MKMEAVFLNFSPTAEHKAINLVRLASKIS